MEFKTYGDYKKWSRNKINGLPLMFAFGTYQMEECAHEHGYKCFDDMIPDLYALPGGSGGFYFKKDAERIREAFRDDSEVLEELIAADKTGEGFIYTMFRYELSDHEYGYTGEIDQTLEDLGYSIDEINADKRLLRGLKKAMREIMEEEA